MQENRGGFRKSTIVILIICGAMIISGIGIALAGVALGGLHDMRDITVGNQKIHIGEPEPLAAATVSVEPFTSMDIEANASNVTFVNDTEWYVVSKYEAGREPLVTSENGTLYIRDAAALSGDDVSLVGGADGPTGINIKDAEGNNVTIGEDGLYITDGDGNDVMIGISGINVTGEDGTQVKVGDGGINVTGIEDGSGTIDIDIGSWNGSYNYEAPSFEIHCPMDTAFEQIALKASWLDAGILSGLTAKEMALDVDSGSMELQGAKIGTLSGSFDYGDLTMTNCTFDVLDFAGRDEEDGGMDSGTFKMTGCNVAGDAAITCMYSDEWVLDNCTFGTLSLTSDSAEPQIRNVTVTGACAAELAYGTLNIENSTFDTLSAKGDGAAFKMVNTTVAKDIVLESTDGAYESKIDNCTFGTFSLKAETLEMDMKSVTVNEASEMTCSSGDVDIESCTLNGLRFEMENGEFDFDGALTGETAIDAEYGEIEMTVHGDKADYAYAINNDGGDAFVDGKPYKAMAAQTAAKNTIQIDVESGDVNLNFVK